MTISKLVRAPPATIDVCDSFTINTMVFALKSAIDHPSRVCSGRHLIPSGEPSVD